jgi:hypothetical protein
LTENIQDEKKSSLAEYIVRRKAILEVFDERLGFLDNNSEKHWNEENLHELICPLRKSSDELTYEDHDLWVIDDRLAFFSYFASDKTFNSMSSTAKSTKKPDILFYDSSLAFQRTDNDDTVVIVEFKRPGRNDYTVGPKGNPIDQVIEYIDILRDMTKKTKNYKGKILDNISENTRFTGYIVADKTPSLEKILRTRDFKSTPDGKGAFSIHEKLNSYLEVIPYSKLISDAKIRNAIFFDKLGLND